MLKNKSLLTLLASLILIFIWFIASILIHKPFFPPPSSAFMGFILLITNEHLLFHFFISLYRILISALISLAIAVPLGILMGRKEGIDNFIMPFVSILYPLPKIVFLPIFIVLLGLGNAPKILIITLIITFQILVVVRDGVRKIPKEYFTSFLTLSSNQWAMTRHLILPCIRGDIITSLRISVGSAIAVLFFAETFVAYDGLGYVILYHMEARNYPLMYGAIIAMSILGISLYTLLSKCEKYYTKWQ